MERETKHQKTVKCLEDLFEAKGTGVAGAFGGKRMTGAVNRRERIFMEIHSASMGKSGILFNFDGPFPVFYERATGEAHIVKLAGELFKGDLKDVTTRVVEIHDFVVE